MEAPATFRECVEACDDLEKRCNQIPVADLLPKHAKWSRFKSRAHLDGIYVSATVTVLGRRWPITVDYFEGAMNPSGNALLDLIRSRVEIVVCCIQDGA